MADNKPKTTRIRFEVSLDVDVESWNLNYGTETVREVQREAREYLMNLLHNTQGGLEYITVAGA